MNESYKMIRENQMSKKIFLKPIVQVYRLLCLPSIKCKKKSHKNKKSLSLFQVRHGTIIHVIP